MSAVLQVNLFEGVMLHRHAYDFFCDDRRFVLALAGTRGAKTYTGARRFWKMVWYRDWPRVANEPYNPGAARKGTALWWDRRPRLHYWVVAPEHALLDEPKRYLLQFLPTELLEHSDNAKGRWWLRGDILIEFKSAHDPTMLVAAGLNGLWMDEADRMKADAWKGQLRARVADKAGWVQATTTPLGKTWTYDAFEKPANDNVPGYGFHTWRTVDNTTLPNLIEEIKDARARLPPEYFKREYEASREAFIGQIFAEFDPHTMIAPALPPEIKLYTRCGGQDWGFTHPGAAIVVGASSTDLRRAHVWVVDERYQTNRLTEDYWIPEVLGLNERWKFNEWSCDPEAPDDIARYRDARINASAHRNFSASKYDEHQRSVKAGIRLMASLIHQRRFHILANCKNLIEEIKSYRWKTAAGNNDVLVEEPAPGQPDHGCLVAGTEVETDRGRVAIENVVAGDLVLTRKQWRPVLASGMTNESAPIFRVTVDNGAIVEGTGDHPFWTEKGWVRLDALRYGDILTTCQESKSSSSMASSTDAIRTPRAWNSGSTTFERAATDCTERSGSSTTAPFQTGTTFTTETRTRSTTTSPISTAFQSSIISADTCPPRSVRPQGSGSVTLGELRQSGMAAPLGSLGIPSTGRERGKSASRSRRPAINAAAVSSRSADETEIGSVRTRVSQHGVEHPASMTSTDHARNVGTFLESTSMRRSPLARIRVVSVCATGRVGPVYNLKVDGEPEFFANGILVHNCDALRYGTTRLLRGATFEALGIAA